MAPAKGLIHPADEVNHFKSIPWCAEHLTSPNLTVIPVFSRAPKPRFEDALFSTTLKTQDTIAAFVCFYPRPKDERGLLPEVKAFVTVGELVNGYPGVCHGGMVASIFDEVLGLIHPGCRWRPDTSGLASVVTAYLNTKYVRPVQTPGTYLVTAWLKKAEGRKIFIEGVMEDGNGARLAEAESLFVETRQKL